MVKLQLKLSTIEDVRNFVNTVSKYDVDVDLKSGRYVVDGKSIMGIFSLDLLNPIEATIHADDVEPLVAELKQFSV